MLGAGRRPKGIDRYLSPAERVIHSCRRHAIILVRPAIYWLGALVAGAAIGFLVSPRTSDSFADSIAGWLVLGFTGYCLVKVLQWWMARYVITDQRVLLIEGLVRVRVSAIPLAKVTDTTFSRSLSGRIFGYGDLLLDSPGEQPGISTLTCLPRPDELYRLIASLVVGRIWERSSESHVLMPGFRQADDDDTGPLPRVIL